MRQPWECSVCGLRFASHFRGALHVQAVHQVGEVIYRMEGQPVNRSLDPDDYLPREDSLGSVKI
jgi:hypothetical protein